MNKYLIWSMALLLAACGTETGIVDTNSVRINRVIPVVQTAQVVAGTLALADIQSIMQKNIEEVLNRGEKLENVSKISGDLVHQSKQFKWGAKKLTWQAMINQYGPIVAMVVFVLFVLYVKFFW